MNETIDNCPDKCKICINGSNLYNLCISCKNENNYYSKYNEYFKSSMFLDCYNIEPQGYYLNSTNATYMPCFTKLNNNDKCEECYHNSHFFH